jgi:hypothetical protein
MMILVASMSFLSRRVLQTSSPSMPGIIMSRSTQSGLLDRILDKALALSVFDTTLWPAAPDER